MRKIITNLMTSFVFPADLVNPSKKLKNLKNRGFFAENHSPKIEKWKFALFYFGNQFYISKRRFFVLGPKKFGLGPGEPTSPVGGVVMVIAESCRRRHRQDPSTTGLR